MPQFANEDELFDKIVSDYDRRSAAGEVVDKDSILEAHPQIAERLLSYFDSMEMLGQFEFEGLDVFSAADGSTQNSDGSQPQVVDEKATLVEPTFGDISDSIYEPGVVAAAEADSSADTKRKPSPSQPVLPATKKHANGEPAGEGLAGSEFGRYHIKRLLGSGMMGDVYLATDSTLERDVAIKIPKSSEVGRPGFIERFYREARAAATLHHPNICQIHDVGEIWGKHYISMAYIDGKPLSALISPETKTSQRKVATLVRKVSAAMYDAHRQGIVHRDLKPDNIMVDQRHEPIVMDFGLARHANSIEEGRLTRTGQLIGTPAYMSPEQVDGESDRIGPQTDIFALGVILFEVLTGQLPFQGKLTVVLRKIATEPPPRPRSLREDIHEGLEAVCLKMLEKSQADRYQSMSDVALSLGAILKGRRTTGTPSRVAPAPAEAHTPKPAGDKPASDKTVGQSNSDLDVAKVASPFNKTDFELMTMEGAQKQIDDLISKGDIQSAVQQLEAMSKLSGTAFKEYAEWASEKLAEIAPMSTPNEGGSSGSAQQRATVLLKEHQFHAAYELLSQIPKVKRDAKVVGLLNNARSKALLVDTLSADIGAALRKGQLTADTRIKAEKLLALNPDHQLAARVIQDIDAANQAGLFGRLKKTFGKQ